MNLNQMPKTKTVFWKVMVCVVGTYFDEDVREDQIHLEL